MEAQNMTRSKPIGISVESLRSHLESNPAIDMAFLFGSVAKAKDTVRSDVDIAVHFSTHHELDDVFHLTSGLERLLGREVDLIVLNSAPASLAWTAIRGVPLLIRNQGTYVEYLLDVSREAEDFEGFLMDLWRLRRNRRAEEGGLIRGQ